MTGSCSVGGSLCRRRKQRQKQGKSTAGNSAARLLLLNALGKASKEGPATKISKAGDEDQEMSKDRPQHRPCNIATGINDTERHRVVFGPAQQVLQRRCDDVCLLFGGGNDDDDYGMLRTTMMG